MRKLLFILCSVLLLSGCSSDDSDLNENNIKDNSAEFIERSKKRIEPLLAGWTPVEIDSFNDFELVKPINSSFIEASFSVYLYVSTENDSINKVSFHMGQLEYSFIDKIKVRMKSDIRLCEMDKSMEIKLYNDVLDNRTSISNEKIEEVKRVLKNRYPNYLTNEYASSLYKKELNSFIDSQKQIIERYKSKIKSIIEGINKKNIQYTIYFKIENQENKMYEVSILDENNIILSYLENEYYSTYPNIYKQKFTKTSYLEANFN